MKNKMNILILHTNNCPRCRILKDLMDSKNMDYEINQDMSILIDMGYMSAPMLQVGDDFLDFGKAIKYVKEYHK